MLLGCQKKWIKILNNEVVLYCKKVENDFMKVIFILFLYTFANISFADQEFDYCLEKAKEMNSMTPIKIDEITTAKSTGCKKGSPHIFQYYLYVDKEVLPEQLSLVAPILRDAKTHLLKSWCSNSDMLKVIGLYDIEYVYRDIKEQYLGLVEIKDRDCKK